MEWDVLFLIPTTWVGPVITPVILSLTMIFLAVLIVLIEAMGKKVVLKGIPISLLISGSVIVILAFIWDYSSYMLQYFSLPVLFSAAFTEEVFEVAYQYVPLGFNWGLFILGELVILAGVFMVYHMNKINKL